MSYKFQNAFPDLIRYPEKPFVEEVEPGTNQAQPSECGKRVIGYYPYFGTRDLTKAQVSRLTHLVFAFMEVKGDGRIVVGSADPTHSPNPEKEAELSARKLEQMFDVLDEFPHVRVMFAVGGWENSQYFSKIASDPIRRTVFIGCVLKIVTQFGFDGVDIDWEYPVTGGAQEGVPEDKINYVVLMQELRRVLDALAEKQEREKYLISFAGAAGSWTLEPGFDLPGLLKVSP